MRKRNSPQALDGVVDRVHSLLHAGEFRKALAVTTARLREPLTGSAREKSVVRFALASLLIDIGGESGNDAAVREGLAILEAEGEHLGPNLDLATYEYNLGNAKKSLFDIERSRPSFRYRPASIELLTTAKNHYWRALKHFSRSGRQASPQLMVNLANVLDMSCRTTEALLWYDRALATAPASAMAHLNRAQTLVWLEQLSGIVTVSLLYEALRGYEVAASSVQLPEYLTRRAEQTALKLRARVVGYGHTVEAVAEQHQRLRDEANSHGRYRRFCLESRLALSEHALYCTCLGARRDDLSIAKPTASIGGEFVGRMELLLNRLKAEFALARLLYFQATAASPDMWDTDPFEGTYTELLEGEAIGLPAEMLRTSFRLCFGILDKVAYGICELFGLASPNEPIYFQSFWKKTKAPDEKQARRWDEINALKNPSLVALYSQATDLDCRSGEWKDFKAWRNALEHNVLVLLPHGCASLGPMVGPRPFDRITLVDLEEFEERCLDLLQLTTSAIFNFVFCVRYEGVKRSGQGGRSIRLEKKPGGPD